MKKIIVVLVAFLACNFANSVKAKKSDCESAECIKAKIERKQNKLANKAETLTEEKKQRIQSSIEALTALLKEMETDSKNHQ